MVQFDFHTEGNSVIAEWGDAIRGKTIVITGTSSNSLGSATATHLAGAHPAKIFLLGRTEAKVQPVIKSIAGISPETRTIFIPIELDDFDSVRSAATAILEQTSAIHILINNAGVMAIPWAKNKQGIEKTLATNHLGHFLLTKELLPALLVAGPGSRVVNLSSGAYKMAPVDFDDWNFSDGETYNPFAAYGQSKTANILFSKGLAQRFEKHGVYAFAAHPGYIPETSILAHLPEMDTAEQDRVAREKTGFAFAPGKPKTLSQGVATTLVAALSPEITHRNGAYLADCQVEDVRGYAKDQEFVDRLWELSEELAGEQFAS
ncbi:hypothetical protein BJX70DRAFT_388860 [Aspergillus crustosus]